MSSFKHDSNMDFQEPFVKGISASLNIDESNKSLLYEDSNSSSSTTYKELQNSFKIPLEQQDFIGKELEDSETSEGTEKEFQKAIFQAYEINEYSEGKDKEIIIDENIPKIKSIKSFSSFEALSSISGDQCNFDQDEEEGLLLKGDEDDKSMISLNQFISSLPIDDEVFYCHLSPVNRDITAEIPLQTVEKDFDDKIIYISEIFDPVHFWFQFQFGDEKYEKFEMFHQKFNDDYKRLKPRELAIGDENFQVGLLVAAYIEKFKRWYRAKIIDNFNNEKANVRLFFVDYGTNGSCRKSSIKYLFQHFLKYPKYCFRGRIHGIVPVHNVRCFKLNEIEEFIKKISHNSFAAKVIKYEPEEDVYQLELIRRKGDLNVREYLLESKFAEPIDPIYNDEKLTIGPPCYLIPTFQALESNYPTYALLESLNRADIDFNTVIDTNHLHSVTRNDVEKNEELQVIVHHPRFSMIKKSFYGF